MLVSTLRPLDKLAVDFAVAHAPARGETHLEISTTSATGGQIRHSKDRTEAE